jgi:hypothetical protein
MRTLQFTLVSAGAVVALHAGTARAQGYGEGEGAADPTLPLYTPYGIGVTLGGGVENFTNTTANDATDLAGSWGVRLELGTHMPVAFEAGYVGTAQTIQGFLGTQDTTLIGTTVEGALKFNVPTGTAFRPFGFVGAGWRRYDLSDSTFAVSNVGIADSDDLVVIPLGAGIRYDYRGIDADVRFTFRPTIGEDLITEPGRDSAALHTWAVGASIGANL